MKVFVNKRMGNYSGGMIIVAANTAEEADKVFRNDDFATWVEIEEYKKENWKEIEGLTCDTDIPCVIDEDGYTE